MLPWTAKPRPVRCPFQGSVSSPVKAADSPRRSTTPTCRSSRSTSAARVSRNADWADAPAASASRIRGPRYGLTQAWVALAGKVAIPEISPPIRLRLEVSADMAWLGCENIVRVELAPGLEVPGIPKTPFRIRSTEVYQRDDGAGNPVWRMWHFHCSPT